MKTCSKCGKEKALDGFYAAKDRKDGYRKDCKACCRARNAAYVENNREELYEASRAYYRENRDTILAKKADVYSGNKEKISSKYREYRAANRERLSEKNRAYYEANRDHLLEKKRRYRIENLECVAARGKARYKADKERILARNRNYTKKNPHIITAKSNKRRAAKLQRTITLAPEHEAELKRIYAEAKRISETTGTLHHVDHIVPLQGKEMSGLHVPWNLEVVPARENLAKSNKVDYSRALPTCTERAHA